MKTVIASLFLLVPALVFAEHSVVSRGQGGHPVERPAEFVCECQCMGEVAPVPAAPGSKRESLLCSIPTKAEENADKRYDSFEIDPLLFCSDTTLDFKWKAGDICEDLNIESCSGYFTTYVYQLNSPNKPFGPLKSNLGSGKLVGCHRTTKAH